MPATGDQHLTTNRRSWGLALLLCPLLVLSACGGDNDSGPQFVTDVHPTSTLNTLDVTPSPAASFPPTMVPTAPPSIKISTRSAPRVAYFMLDGVLTSYDSGNREFTTIELPDDLVHVDHSASPTGDRVAVLAVQGNRLVVQFFGADGVALTEPILLSVPAIPVVATAQATPEATPTAVLEIPDHTNQMHVEWVPQGNAVLVSGPGVNQRVSMNGEVMPISRTGVAGTVIKSVWSPMNMQVAIQTQHQRGDQSVYMLDTGHDEAQLLEAFEDLNGNGMSNLQWMPNGLGLVVVSGKVENGVVMNGQLYSYRFDDEAPTLLATSGQGGPNSTITHAVISPDGHTIVYAVMVRDLSQWHLHSLWIRSMKGGPAVAIPTESGAPLISLQWTEEGIVWQQVDGTLNVVDESLIPRVLGTEPIATPVVEATPAATPVDDLGPVG